MRKLSPIEIAERGRWFEPSASTHFEERWRLSHSTIKHNTANLARGHFFQQDAEIKHRQRAEVTDMNYLGNNALKTALQ
jgi:hypothetical protein